MRRRRESTRSTIRRGSIETLPLDWEHFTSHCRVNGPESAWTAFAYALLYEAVEKPTHLQLIAADSVRTEEDADAYLERFGHERLGRSRN
jgi:hypothetical protein